MPNFPWTKSYPAGVRWDETLHLSSVQALLDEAVQQWPEHPAISFMGKTLSYRQLSALVDRAASGFQKLGVQPGVHVGLYLPNTPHYVISFFGVLRAGGTVVNYSPLDAAQVLEHKVDDSETDILVTLNLNTLYPTMKGLLGTTRLTHLVVGTLGEFSAMPDAVDKQLMADGTSSAVVLDAQQHSFAQLLDNDGQYTAWPLGDVTQTVAVLQYTGGTTGLPKGAMLTHGNITAATLQAAKTSTLDGALLQPGCERVLVVLPLFHVYAMVVDMLLGIKIGAELVLCTKFDPEAVLKDISARRITCFPGVPTMFTALVSHPRVADYDLRSLKVCNSGGAPMPVELLQRFEALTGCHLTEGWGMTETASLGSFTPVIGLAKPGSCGMPAPNVRLQFLDVENPGQRVPLGERGEIAIAGPNVMRGYWKNPQATADSFTPEGFFRTGDVGYMDTDGFVYIVDRTKDMLLCGGFNVYPRLIEEAIYAHPLVQEVMVIGVPDTYRGQSPKAYIKLKADATPITLEALKDFLKDRLGKHEMVHAMELRDDLPKTAVGKLSKKMLHDQLARETQPT